MDYLPALCIKLVFNLVKTGIGKHIKIYKINNNVCEKSELVNLPLLLTTMHNR